MSDIFNMVDTWNAIGTTFNGIMMDISNGAGGAPVGAAASRAFRLDSNGTSIFDVTIAGLGMFAAGVTTGGGVNTTGLSSVSQGLELPFGGAGVGIYSAAYAGLPMLSLGSTGIVAWNSGNATSGTLKDVILARDAANTLAQRNGTTAQTFNIYNTYANSGTDYERLAIKYSSNNLLITTERGGTGLARQLYIGSNVSGNPDAALNLQGSGIFFYALTAGGSAPWNMSSTGHFLAGTDNTYDIGASGATRPRNLYVAGTGTFGSNVQGRDIYSSAGRFFGDVSRTVFLSPSDGVITVSNNGQTDFTRFQFGGTTNLFSAIARIGTGLQFQTADGATTGTWYKSTVLTLASLSASVISAASAGNGGIAYITDFTTATFVKGITAAGGGTLGGIVYSDGTQWRAA